MVTRCNCEVPCLSTEYKHDLSLSDLSSFNVKRLVFQNNLNSERSDQLEDKFITAQDARQRVVDEISNADVINDNQFSLGLSRVMISLDSAIIRLDSGELVGNIKALREGVKEDRILLNSTLMGLWFNFATHVVDVQVIRRSASAIKKVFDDIAKVRYNPNSNQTLAGELQLYCETELDQYTFRLKEAFMKLIGSQVIQTSGVSGGSSDSGGTAESGAPAKSVYDDDMDSDMSDMSSMSYIESWMMNSTMGDMSWKRRRRSTGSNMTSTTNPTRSTYPGTGMSTPGYYSSSMPPSTTIPTPCGGLIDRLASTMMYQEGNLPNIHETNQVVSNLTQSYMTDINVQFNGSSISPDSIPEHRECVGVLEHIQFAWQPYFDLLVPMIARRSTSNDDTYYFEFAAMLDNITKMAEPSASAYTDGVGCFWLRNYIDLNSMEDMLEKLKQAEDLLFSVDGTRSELVHKMAKLEADYLDVGPVPELLNLTAKHLEGSIEKLEMAEVFGDDRSQMVLESIYEKSEEYRRIGESFDSKYHQISFNIQGVIDSIFNAQIPVIGNNSDLMKAWRNLYKATIRTMDGTIPDTSRDGSKKVVTDVMKSILGTEIERSILPVKDNMKTFMKASIGIAKSLQRYVEECDFGDAHFM